MADLCDERLCPGFAWPLFLAARIGPRAAGWFSGGAVFTGIMAIPFSSFYTRTPERLLGRLNSLGAGMGSIIIALASLFFGWIINVTSAKTGILACALVMGLISLGVLFFPS